MINGATRSLMSTQITALETQIEIRELQPGERGQWDRFVASAASGTFFHQTGWTNVVENVLGHRIVNLVAWRGRSITGVFPISWIRNKIFGDCLVSLPLA